MTDEPPIMISFQDKKAHHNVRGWQYSMKGHAEQCVEKYLELSGKESGGGSEEKSG